MYQGTGQTKIATLRYSDLEYESIMDPSATLSTRERLAGCLLEKVQKAEVSVCYRFPRPLF